MSDRLNGTLRSPPVPVALHKYVSFQVVGGRSAAVRLAAVTPDGPT